MSTVHVRPTDLIVAAGAASMSIVLHEGGSYLTGQVGRVSLMRTGLPGSSLAWGKS